MALKEFTLTHSIDVCKHYTSRYAKNHKGRNALEKKCLKQGYLICKIGEIDKNCSQNEKNKLGLFALDFNLVQRKGGFVLVK